MSREEIENFKRERPGSQRLERRAGGLTERRIARASPAAHSGQLSAFSSDCVGDHPVNVVHLACPHVQKCLWRNHGGKRKPLHQATLAVSSHRKKKLRPHSTETSGQDVQPHQNQSAMRNPVVKAWAGPKGPNISVVPPPAARRRHFAIVIVSVLEMDWMPKGAWGFNVTKAVCTRVPMSAGRFGMCRAARARALPSITPR